MKNQSVIIIGLVVLALLCMVGITTARDTVTTTETTAAGAQDTLGATETEDIPPYDGAIGADSPLYGLKLAWEDFDESFTTDESERIDKQMNHARLRLSEVRREFAENRTDTAQQAIDLYWQKVNLTQARIAFFGSNATGLLHAQEMHNKHQIVLEDLLLSHPNNTGLARAYNNSLILEQKFEEKTQIRFEKIIEKNNRTIIKAYRLEVQEENRAGNGDGVWNETEKQTRNEGKVKTRDTATVTPQQPAVTTDTRDKTVHGKTSPSVTVSPQQGTPAPVVTTSPQQGTGSDDTMGNGNGNSDDKGKGNSHKK